MSDIDPNILKLLKMRQKIQERRLNELSHEIRTLEHKLAELASDVAAMDLRRDGYSEMSVENGFLTFANHRRTALIRQIDVLKEQANLVQDALRKSVFSQSMLENDTGA